MVYFDYCPVMGLKDWEFIGDPPHRPNKIKTKPQLMAIIENLRWNRMLLTQHRRHGRKPRSSYREDE